MSALKLDSAGDLSRTNKFERVTGIDERRQRNQVALKTFQGEWFLDIRDGVPYIRSTTGDRPILGQLDYSLNEIEQILREKILDVPGNTSIFEYSQTLSKDENKTVLSVDYTVMTDLGPVQVTGEIFNV
jgi:hypothetical protein